MSVPGSNMLNRAARLIKLQPIAYYAYTGRETNEAGLYDSTYAQPRVTQGSLQPVPRSLYDVYGLDFDKNYSTVYLAKNSLDIARNVAGDQLTYGSRRFQVESKTDWFGQDGWDALLCIEVPVP